MKKKVEIFVPIMNGVEYSDYFGNINRVFKEFLQLSGMIEIKFQNRPISILKIQKMTKRNSEIKKVFGNQYERSVIKNFFRFYTELIIDDKKEVAEKKYHYYSLEYFVEGFVKQLLVYSNLAKPGAFDTREGKIRITEFLDTEKIQISDFTMLANSIPYSLELCEKYKWPPLKELPLNSTLTWLYHHSFALENLSKSRIQRALNAFSYLFHESFKDNDPGDLFFSLIGIEAIYAQNSNNIQDQVNQKSQLLLGKRNEFKKIFNELYDYRSRYIHGQLNFTNKFFFDDEESAIEQILKTYEKSAFAIAILTSTIQKHIEENKEEFEYELVLKE